MNLGVGHRALSPPPGFPWSRLACIGRTAAGVDQAEAELLRRHVLREVFDRICTHSPHQLSEQEALTLANEKPDAMCA